MDHRNEKERCLTAIQADTEWVESTLIGHADADTADYQAQLITIRLANHLAKRLLTIVSGRGAGDRTVDIDFVALQELASLLTEYKEILTSYLKKGKGGIKRVFRSSKLRKRLDQVNAKLHKKLGEFVEQLKSEKKKPGEAAPPTSAESRPSPEPSRKDEAGRSPSYVSSCSSWVSMFQTDIMVPWEHFIARLRGFDSEIDETLDSAMEVALREALDSNNTGSVPVFRWEEFLKAFGPMPLSSVIRKAQRTMSAPWFHGHLTAPDAEKLLHNSAVGTFLVRFSLSIAGSFAIAFVAGEGVISHTLVVPKEDGLFVQAESTTGPFDSLHSIISHYKDILQVPFESALTTEKWFFGDVSSSEAGLLLQGQSPGTYIMRFSSIPGCLAATYVTDDHAIRHSLIEPTADRSGYVVQGTEVAYPTLPELVAKTPVFVEPLA